VVGSIIAASANKRRAGLIQVKITRGHHRGQEVSGLFVLIKNFREIGAGEGELTVSDVNGLVPWKQTNPIRVKLNKADFQLLDAEGEALGAHVVLDDDAKPGQPLSVSTNYEQAFVATETDDEAMDRIENTFLMLDKITDAAAKGVIRGLVVSGPPGIGKSYGVEKQLAAANLFRTMAGEEPEYETVSGGISSIGLFQKLYHNRKAGRVLVFDDCDGVLFDEEMLNLLKSALNSGEKRSINWNKESRVLLSEDIPNKFDFEASVLFLSNIDFERTIAKGSRIAAHLDAIMSRCHYLDLEIGSTRDKLLRIKQIIRGGMLAPYGFSKAQEQSVVDFVFDNSDFMRELSLRSVKKVADFVKADPKGWHEMAEATILTREAKFKRLIDKREVKAAAKGTKLIGHKK
jgi:hypothetical protein